jgi:hypothetical protein
MEVLAGDDPDVWINRLRISADMPPIPNLIDVLRKWRGQSHDGLLNVFENTWKKEPHQSWEYWRDREAASWGPLQWNKCQQEIRKLDEIVNGRRQPQSVNEIQPHPVVMRCHEIAERIQEAGCPVDQRLRQAIAFLQSPVLITAPFIQIACSIYACLGKNAPSQVKPPTRGFYNDVDVMSCLLPYCDAMFVDRECAAYWREIQNSPTRRFPYDTCVFSLSTKREFLDYLDELDLAIPDEQRQLAQEVYG